MIGFGSTEECANCGHLKLDHDETGCNWRRHGALRHCNCPGFVTLKNMEKKKIRINDWSQISRDKNTKISKGLEGVDKVLVGIIPKMFYHYEADENSNIFIVVPVEYEDKVREIVRKIVVSIEYEKYDKIINTLLRRKRREKE